MGILVIYCGEAICKLGCGHPCTDIGIQGKDHVFYLAVLCLRNTNHFMETICLKYNVYLDQLKKVWDDGH